MLPPLSYGFKMFIRTLLVIFLSCVKLAFVVVFSRSIAKARQPADAVQTVLPPCILVHGQTHLRMTRITKHGHVSTYCITCMFCCLLIIYIIYLNNGALEWRSGNRHAHTKNSSYRLIQEQNVTDSEDTALTSYKSSFEQKDTNLRAILNSSMHIERQKCIVFQSALDTYFSERLGGNANTSELMKYEWSRYTTFNTFPMESPMMPLRLAANGFYYNGTGDSVTCFSCGLQYSGWQEGDCSTEIHATLSPACGFLTGTDHLNIGIHTDDIRGATGSGATGTCGGATGGGATGTCGGATGSGATSGGTIYGQVGIQSDDVETYTQKQCRQSTGSESTPSRSIHHKYPDYERYEYRMDTYTGWPCSDIISPKQLAGAGYFYAGTEAMIITQ